MQSMASVVLLFSALPGLLMLVDIKAYINLQLPLDKCNTCYSTINGIPAFRSVRLRFRFKPEQEVYQA